MPRGLHDSIKIRNSHDGFHQSVSLSVWFITCKNIDFEWVNKKNLIFLAKGVQNGVIGDHFFGFYFLGQNGPKMGPKRPKMVDFHYFLNKTIF